MLTLTFRNSTPSIADQAFQHRGTAQTYNNIKNHKEEHLKLIFTVCFPLNYKTKQKAKKTALQMTTFLHQTGYSPEVSVFGRTVA